MRELRRRLRLTQAAFAERLGVSVRTVIRGEQRGLEIPWRSDSRDGVREAWAALQREAIAVAADPLLNVTPRAIARKVSRPKRRLSLSRERLKKWKAQRRC